MTTTVYSVTSRIIAPLKNDLQASSTKAALAALRESINRDTQRLGLVWQLLFEKMPSDFLSRTGELTYEERSILNALQLFSIHQRGNTTSVDIDSKREEKDQGTFNVRFRSNQFIVKGENLDNKDETQVHTFDNYKEVVNQLNEWHEELIESEKDKRDDSNSEPDQKHLYFKDIGKSLRELRMQYDDKTAIDRRFNAMITARTYDEIINHLRSLIRLLKSKGQIIVDYSKLAQDLFWFLNSDDGADRTRMSWCQSYYA